MVVHHQPSKEEARKYMAHSTGWQMAGMEGVDARVSRLREEDEHHPAVIEINVYKYSWSLVWVDLSRDLFLSLTSSRLVLQCWAPSRWRASKQTFCNGEAAGMVVLVCPWHGRLPARPHAAINRLDETIATQSGFPCLNPPHFVFIISNLMQYWCCWNVRSPGQGCSSMNPLYNICAQMVFNFTLNSFAISGSWNDQEILLRIVLIWQDNMMSY